MLLIEAEKSLTWGKTYINANMVQDFFAADGYVMADLFDKEGYTPKIAKFEDDEQATAALERLIPYLGKSGDGIVKLAQWTGKESNNVG